MTMRCAEWCKTKMKEREKKKVRGGWKVLVKGLCPGRNGKQYNDRGEDEDIRIGLLMKWELQLFTFLV